MRIRSALFPGSWVFAAAAVLAACGSSPTTQNTSSGNAGGSGTTTAAVGSATNGSAGSGAGNTSPADGNGGGSAGNGGGASGGAGQPSGQGGGSSAPAVTSVNAPGTVTCPPGQPTVDITVRYAVANAKLIEYLRPGSDRPGAGNATGSLMLTYDCSKASQTYQIRAFNEFAANGSDSKDPSPYKSFTVTRAGSSASSSTASSSTASTTKAPASSSTATSTTVKK